MSDQDTGLTGLTRIADEIKDNLQDPTQALSGKRFVQEASMRVLASLMSGDKKFFDDKSEEHPAHHCPEQVAKIAAQAGHALHEELRSLGLI